MSTNTELLAAFMKSNKIARTVKAKKLGFKSWEDYRDHLKGIPKEATVMSSSKPTIHIVDILDCSSSMGWGSSKLKNAVKAINKQIGIHQKEIEVKYTYSLCVFSWTHDIKFPYFTTPMFDVSQIKAEAYGNTALFDAIGQTLEKLKKISANDKVLVNIYTDGGENGSRHYKREQISKLIAKVQEEGFTVTFIGTETDVQAVVDHLNIDKSNTLTYDGTGVGLEVSMQKTSLSRSTYAKKVVKGEDVSRGFYKDVIKK